MKDNVKQKSEQAAFKKLEARRARMTAKQFGMSSDVTGSKICNIEAQRLEEEANELLKHDGTVIIGSGGEVCQNDPGNLVTDLLLKDPSMAALDASEHRLELLERVDCIAPTLDAAESIGARNSLEKMMAHQMAVVHSTAMTLLEEAKAIRRTSNSINAEMLSLKKQNMARMFMDTYMRQMEAIARIRSGGRQNIVVTYQNVHVSGGQAVIADQVTTGGRDGGDNQND
jgi:hypothetical protein